MARTLHISSAGTLRFSCLLVLMATGCVISPPIASEPIAPDRAPRLDFMAPPDRNITVDGPNPPPIRLSVRAFDENPHDFLDVIWVGDEALRANVVNVARQSDMLEEGEIEYRYDVIELEIQPCEDLPDVSKETVSVYVSDASLDLVGNNVELSDPGGGGFIATFSWILNIRAGACL